MATTANQGDYTLDTGILWVKGWSFGSGSTTLSPERVSIDEILRLRAATSTPSSPAYRYAVEGSDLLMIWPTPSGVSTITIYYVPRPTSMSSGTHDPSNATYGGVPLEYHPVVESYALWKLASADDDESSGQGQRYKDDYLEGIGKIRKYVAKKGGALPRAKVGRRGLVRLSPSQDV